jgi:hypothetical protein
MPIGTTIANVDVAKQFSDDTFVGKIKTGAVYKLTQRLPEVQIGETSFFNLAGRTKGEVVGEAAAKSPTPSPIGLSYIRTVKLQYTERFSDEFVTFDEQKRLGILNTMANKWLSSDFTRDLDTIIIHGINPLTGAVSTSIDNYITKPGSSIQVPTTGDTAAAINTDLITAIDALEDAGTDINGIAFAPAAASKLATLTNNGIQTYPSLGKFGLNVTSFEGMNATTGKEVGEYNGVKLVAGDWDQLRWGIAKEMPVKMIEYGDPDGLGDLQRYNQVALRFEAIVGFGIVSPDAFAVVMNATTSE